MKAIANRESLLWEAARNGSIVDDKKQKTDAPEAEIRTSHNDDDGMLQGYKTQAPGACQPRNVSLSRDVQPTVPVGRSGRATAGEVYSTCLPPLVTLTA